MNDSLVELKEMIDRATHGSVRPARARVPLDFYERLTMACRKQLAVTSSGHTPGVEWVGEGSWPLFFGVEVLPERREDVVFEP